MIDFNFEKTPINRANLRKLLVLRPTPQHFVRNVQDWLRSQPAPVPNLMEPPAQDEEKGESEVDNPSDSEPAE